MLSKIIAASVRNKLLVAFMLLRLIAWGGYSAVNIPLDAIPDATNNQVQVITQSDALAAQEVEQLITIPLELQPLHGARRYGNPLHLALRALGDYRRLPR
ncbi:MAG: efflux RND transporter permease subunit [Hymenobacter sp.]